MKKRNRLIAMILTAAMICCPGNAAVFAAEDFEAENTAEVFAAEDLSAYADSESGENAGEERNGTDAVEAESAETEGFPAESPETENGETEVFRTEDFVSENSGEAIGEEIGGTDAAEEEVFEVPEEEVSLQEQGSAEDFQNLDLFADGVAGEEFPETAAEPAADEDPGLLSADLVSGDWTYTVSKDGAVITGYKGSASSLAIPSSIDGNTVKEIRYGAFQNNKNLVSVTIPSEVEKIGSIYDQPGAFAGCVKLQSVTINAGTGVAYIGTNTFRGCSSLASVVIPGNYTEIYSNAFRECFSMTDMEYRASGSTYPDQVIASGAFYGCKSLRSAKMPGTLVEIGSDAFRDCANLTGITLNEGLQTIGTGAFYGCEKLPSVVIPSTVVKIGSVYDNAGAFENCVKLASVTVREGNDTAYLGQNTFRGCTSLTAIEIPGNYNIVYAKAFFGCLSLKTMNYKEGGQRIDVSAFEECKNLTSAVISSTVESIGNNAFKNCANLNSLTLNEGLKTIGYGAFCACGKLPLVVIPSTVTEIGSEYDYNGAFEACTKLASVTIKAGTEEARLGRHTFENCSSLSGIVIPGNYTEVCEQAFRGCTSLKTMEYRNSGYNYNNQRIDSQAFENCSSLQSAVIPGTVALIGVSAFKNCANLTSLTLNEGLQSIERGAFCGCGKLPSVTIPSTVTAIGSIYDYEGAFEDCVKLASVTIKAGTEDAYLGQRTFKNCSSLADIVIPGNYAAIRAKAFYDCTSLKKMEYKKSSFSFANQVIDIEAFRGCKSLISAVVPGTVESIGRSAFQDCTSLTSVTLNEGLTTIGLGTFYGCTSLASIVIPSTVLMIGSEYDYDGAFENCSRLERVEIKKNTNEDYGTLGRRTFKNCAALSYVYIPSTYTTLINKDIFAGHGDSLVIWGEWGSEAEKFAKANDIPFNQEVLAVPKNIKAVNGSSYVKVTWDSVTNASGYIVLRKTGSGSYQQVAEVSSASYQDKNVSSGTKYEYSVKAKKGSAAGGYLKDGAITVWLAVPSVTLTNGGTGVKVSWNKITGADGYYVYRKKGSGSYSRIASVASGTRSYVDTSVKTAAGTKYSYAVRAKKGSYTSTYTGKTILRLPNPSFSAANTADGIKVTWKKVSGATKYVVYRKGASGSYKKIKTIVKSGAGSYTDTAVKNSNGSTYAYGVRAVSGSYMSAYSGLKIARLKAPSISKISSSSRKLTVKWAKNTKASGFQVQYCSKKTFSGAKTVTVRKASATSAVTPKLVKGRKYYIRVRAYKTVSGKNYFSAWSKVSSKTAS